MVLAHAAKQDGRVHLAGDCACRRLVVPCRVAGQIGFFLDQNVKIWVFFTALMVLGFFVIILFSKFGFFCLFFVKICVFGYFLTKNREKSDPPCQKGSLQPVMQPTFVMIFKIFSTFIHT